MTSGQTLLLSGAVCSSGVWLALAGAGKVWRGDQDTAIRHVLRIRAARWRLAESGTGAVECMTGAAVCLGAVPLLAGSAMAVLGSTFAALLVQARRTGAPGGCGCLPWRYPAGAITWPAIMRAGCVLAAGVTDAAIRLPGPSAIGHAWFDTGAVAAAIVYVLLSVHWPVRTPRCHRRLWFPTREGLTALTGNAVFTAFAESYGPFTAAVGYRRDGCTDQFSLAAGSAEPRRELLFDVSRGPGGTVAVRASVHDGLLAGGLGGRLLHLPPTRQLQAAAKLAGTATGRLRPQAPGPDDGG